MLNWHPLHGRWNAFIPLRNVIISGWDHFILFKIEDLGINLCKGLLDSQKHINSQWTMLSVRQVPVILGIFMIVYESRCCPNTDSLPNSKPTFLHQISINKHPDGQNGIEICN